MPVRGHAVGQRDVADLRGADHDEERDPGDAAGEAGDGCDDHTQQDDGGVGGNPKPTPNRVSSRPAKTTTKTMVTTLMTTPNSEKNRARATGSG